MFGRQTVAYYEVFSFSCAKSSWIPFRIALPFVMLCLLQYATSLLSVSLSILMLYLISFGLSTFGLPIFAAITIHLLYATPIL